MASRSNPFPMGASDPLPAGYVIWFGSLEFRATGNGYLMELLSPRCNTDVTSPAEQAPEPALAISAHGAAQGGTPQLPHVG